MNVPESWEIEIAGSETDLNLISDLDGEMATISNSDGTFMLRFPCKESETAREAYLRGEELLRSLNALSRMRFSGFGSLTAKAALRKLNSDGTKNLTIFASPVTISVRGFPATLTINGEVHNPTDPIRARLQISSSDTYVSRVLRLRNVGDLDWTQMFRILEIIETDRNIVEVGWITANDRKRFKHTANSVAAAGDKARHGSEVTSPPANPMGEVSARKMLDRIIECWIDEKADQVRS